MGHTPRTQTDLEMEREQTNRSNIVSRAGKQNMGAAVGTRMGGKERS